MPTAMARGDGKEGPISPHQAPLLERLSSRDEDTVEDELNEDLGYPTLGTGRRNWLDRATDRSSSVLKWLRQITRGRYEDWLFLFLLGSLMGLYSFGIDLFVSSMQRYRLAAFMAAQGLAAQIVTWFILTAGIAIIVALTLSWFIPTAAGSGFPELKAYLQGVKMENAFSPFTCMGKLVFLPIILSSALPLGREGPMTHVAAIFALFITKIFKDISVEELERHTGNELVAAACTIGVAVTYGAPVGGVLFSIEATRTYFAVRNYWRGFFAAVCGTVFYKGLSQMYLGIDILPMYKETYTEPLPFNFEFLGISIAIGLLCGLLGPGWVWLHRHLGYLLQKLNSMSPVCRCCCTSPKPAKDEKAGGQAEQKQQKKKRSCSLGVKTHPVTVFRCLYNIGICLVIAAAVLPWRDGYSPLMSHISGRQQMTDLMANISWKLPPLPSPSSCVSSEEGDRPNCTAGLPCPAEDDPEDCEDPPELTDHQKATRDRTEEIAARWTDDFALDYRAVLVLYALFYAFGTLLCASVTLPTGALIPSFKVGVAIGRLLGEFYCTYRMSVCLPNPAVISGFACMCGAALTGAITHSISISVIVFELTGQITYVLPILISVLVANALARHLQPSFFDSVIKSKKITVLPKMVLSKIPGGYANIRAQDLMSTEFRVFTQRATLNSLRKMVRYVHDPAKVLPLVDDEVSMEPLGLVHVRRVRRLLREELGQLAWNRDKPRVYLTMNAFKALDWDRVRNAPAVGQLGLEIDRPGSTSPRPGSPAGDTASPTVPRRNSAGQLAFEDSHPETYCTVNTGLMDGVKARLMARKRGPAHLIVPRRPINVRGQRAGPEAPSGPLTTVQETPHEPAPAAAGRRSRFVVRRVEESAAAAEAEKEPLMAPEIHVNGTGEGQKCNGSAGDADDSAISSGDVTTATPSNGSRGHRRSASDALLQSSTHPDGTPGRKASDPNDVYDSLVSNCSRASRLRDGIAKMLPKRSGNLNLEERKQNAQQRLNRQFSLSDLHQGEGDTMNMTQFFQRTLDRTSNIFSGMKSTEPSETEVRLRRAWRRRQLNREVELREVIEIDPFPLAVNVDTPLVQIHKMFAMLCANRMYVMDRRRLVGCLTLQRLSEFITRGCVDQPPAPPAAEPDKHPPPVARRDSQDTLDDVDEGVYDTITEPPGPLPTAAAATSAV